MLTERAVRDATLARIESRWGDHPDTLVVEEMGTHFGAARVDVAVVNGALWGFELKSEVDRLSRLPGQVLAFSEVFDYMTIVAASRLLRGALEIVPDWWGVVEALPARESGAILKERRKPRRNPTTSPEAVAGLLWRDELLAVAEVAGSASGLRSADRLTLQRHLAETLTQQDLAAAVRRTIRARQAWRASPERERCGVTCEPARTRSRFLARRLR